MFLSMMRRPTWDERFPKGKLYYETVRLNTLELVAKHSFVARKSVHYLDLSLREFSSLSEKRKVLVPLLFCSADPAYSKKFVCTAEGCRKTLILERRWLYTLHLDLPIPRENQFLTLIEDDGSNFWKPKTICCNDLLVRDNVYQKSFRSFIEAALDQNGMEMDFVRRQMSLMKRILGVRLFEFSSIEDRILHFLYPDCTDSETVKEFLSIIDFHSLVLTNPKQDIFEYLTFHAYQVKYDLKLNDTEGTLVNECFFNGRYKYAELLMQYHNAPFYYNYDCGILVSSWMRSTPFLARSIRSLAGLGHLNRDVQWCPEDVDIPFKKGLVSKRRHLLWLQIVFAFLVCRESTKNGNVTVTLGVVWRSLPDAFFTLKEVTASYENVPKFIDNIPKIHKFYVAAIGTDPATCGVRSLQHYCRVSIRKSLCYRLELPFGVQKLHLPDKLKAFIKLEK